MEMKEMRYLNKANDRLPSNWKLMESKRITRSGAPTFHLFLVIDYGLPMTWHVYAEEPRRKLRSLVEAVAEIGVLALLDEAFDTYTSRVTWRGYTCESLGLREFFRYLEDPEVDRLIDSVPYLETESKSEKEGPPPVVEIIRKGKVVV